MNRLCELGRRALSRRGRLGLLVWVWLLAACASHADAATVIVRDVLTTPGTETLIRVQTRNGPFAAGGERVRLAMANAPEVEILTGGDGMGFWKIIPQKPGLQIIRARSGADEGRGLLFAAATEDRLVAIEVEQAIGIRQTVGIAGGSTRAAIEQIAKSHRLIYVASGMGLSLARAWVRLNRLPEAPVLTEDPDDLADRLTALALTLRAAVGSDPFLKLLKPRSDLAFSFEPSENGRQVDGWETIREVLSP